MRAYERSHPWITFSLDLGRIAWSLWMLLGEAQSKIDHLSGVPLRPATASLLHRVYLAKGAVATTAIEGNTLSEEDVQKYLDGKLELPPSKEYLKQEIHNIVTAFDWIFSQGMTPLSPALVKEFNFRTLTGLTVGEEVQPGTVRSYRVGVGRYLAPPSEDCDFLLHRLCAWLSTPEFEGTRPTRIAFAIIRAVLAHLYLAWIHPFGDGNGRTARLAEFQILVSAGVPTPAAHLLSNHYNDTRTDYYRQLDYASKSGGDIVPFIQYAVQGFVDGLRSQLDFVRAQQLDVAWRNYVHETFKAEAADSARRQRRLLLDLSRQPEPVPRNKLTEISVRVAKEYAGKTQRTLARDINDLCAKGLMVGDAKGYRANVELILAFLPERHRKLTPHPPPPEAPEPKMEIPSQAHLPFPSNVTID